MRPLITLALFALTTACTVAQPFDGPGVDDAMARRAPLIAAITHTRIAEGGEELFEEQLDAIVEQQDDHEGFVGRSLRTEVPGRIRWTLTVWDDEESMMRFVTEGAHLDAMLNWRGAIDGVRSAVWMIHPDDHFPPTWDEALERLEEQAPRIPWE